jgi:hypothetical protein
MHRVEALMPKVANGIDLVYKPWQVHAENFELAASRTYPSQTRNHPHPRL